MRVYHAPLVVDLSSLNDKICSADAFVYNRKLSLHTPILSTHYTNIIARVKSPHPHKHTLHAHTLSLSHTHTHTPYPRHPKFHDMRVALYRDDHMFQRLCPNNECKVRMRLQRMVGGQKCLLFPWMMGGQKYLSLQLRFNQYHKRINNWSH